MSNKFQELKNLRKSGTNFNDNQDENIEGEDFQDEDKRQYGEFSENENPDNIENLVMENYNNENIENPENQNDIENNANNYEMEYNYNQNEINDEDQKNNFMNEENYIKNEENYGYDVEEKKDKSKYSNIYDLNDKNSMSHTPRTVKSRIEIDANENYHLNKANIDMEGNATKIKTKTKKIFMTDNQTGLQAKEIFTFHDLIIPNSKTAKICFIKDIYSKNLRLTEIADHFQFYEPTPIIVLIGANTTNKVKILAGLTRAALNTRASIIDSGLFTGIEKFCNRKNINIIGIAPKGQVELPKLSNEKYSSKTLSQGHSHFILLDKEGMKLDWGDEARMKMNFAERLASGRKGFSYKCKIVGVILGNIPKCEDEINYFVEKELPLILVDDSDLTSLLRKLKKGEKINGVSEKLKTIANYRKLIDIEDNSENLASAIHICLTLTF